MKTSQEYIDILRSHAEELKDRFNIRSMVLFGSVARNEQTENSDIDLFVDMPPVCLNACAAMNYLEDLLGCPIDLVRNHSGIRPFFKKQIEQHGITIIPTA